MARKTLKDLSSNAPSWMVRLMVNVWSPFVGAGIDVTHFSKDFRHAKITLKKHWYTQNYVGVQFGGSIYAMTDPFYMLMLIHNLGSEYIVWDKAAEIDFKRPGKTELYVEFKIDDKLIDEVRQKTASGEKYIFTLPVDVVDAEGMLVARVKKVLYVKLK